MYTNIKRLPSARLIVLSLLIVGLTMLAAIPNQAYAWSYAGTSGTAGSVSVPTIYVGDINIGYGPMFTLYGSTGPIVYRSPASSGNQTVMARYQVEGWDGSRWEVVSTTQLPQGQIAATQTAVQFVAPYIMPTTNRGYFYFRFTWAFDWYSSNGILLGSTWVVPNVASDHVCVTPYTHCQSYAGYFLKGS